MSDKVTPEYIASLEEVNQLVTKKRVELRLPPLTDLQNTTLMNRLTFTAYRSVHHLWYNQGAKRQDISSAVAVGNVSEAFIGRNKTTEAALNAMGLKVTCDRVKAMNRYDVKTVIGHWWLEISDPVKWQKAQLEQLTQNTTPANDSDFKQSA